MPAVKIARKSTDFDMTPFVDVAFLILSFFMLATKFKPPEPVEITTPNSVSTIKLPENDGVMVEMDKDGRVFVSMLAGSAEGTEAKRAVIENLNKTRNLGLTETEIRNYVKGGAVGVPFSQLKGLLSRSPEELKKVVQPGIPVRDSATNELVWWIRDAKSALAGKRVNYVIKADNGAKYPDFKHVLDAFKRNDENKFLLVTSPEEAPVGTPLAKSRAEEKARN